MDASRLQNSDEATVPLFVDLDGTLIHGDSLWETFFALPKVSFRSFILACLIILKGRVAFKNFVASAVAADPESLLVNEEVFAFAREEAASRPVILATAAHLSVAEAFARKAGFFEDVIGTRDGENAKSAAKLAAIKRWLVSNSTNREFDYIGDSPADRPIWAEARHAHVVGSSRKAASHLVGGLEIARYFEAQSPTAIDFVKAMRPHQWIKNVLIFLPILLSHQILEPMTVAFGVIAFVSFSLCASATYIWNDIVDIKADRAHERKRARPIASGRISIPSGLGFSALLLIAGFAIAFAFLPFVVPLLFVGYIVFTLSYSLYLKEKLLVDALTLGLLYGYRIFIGSAATGIAVSDWLFAFSVFFFLGLALVKRFSEILCARDSENEKIAGRGYYSSDREVVSTLGIVSSFVAILVMSLYINSPDVVDLYSRPKILWLICLVMIYWVARVWVLAHRGHMPDDPIVFALKDRVSLLCGLICASTTMLAA